jgi:hypothetical protein
MVQACRVLIERLEMDGLRFVRQAAIMFGIAKATKDAKVSAALFDKAADLKSKVDGPSAPLDLIPLVPDIEPPSAT